MCIRPTRAEQQWGEGQSTCEQKRPLTRELCSSFLTWSIKEELNSNIIGTEVRSLVGIM